MDDMRQKTQATVPEDFSVGDDEETNISEASNRRKHERRIVSLDASLHFGDSVYPCEVKDVSAGGARVEIDAPLDILDIIALHITGLKAFECTVVWVRAPYIGLMFTDDPETVKDALTPLGLT